MKKLLSLSITLLMLGACVGQKAPLDVAQPDQSQTGAAIDTKNEETKVDNELKISTFDMKLLQQNEDGSFNPINPEDVDSINFNGQSFDLNSIVLPGENAKDPLTTKEGQEAELKKVNDGKNLFLYNGGGIYSVYAPESKDHMTMDVKLKGKSTSSRIVLVNNMTQGTFVFKDNIVTGGFATEGSFTTKQATGVIAGVLDKLNESMGDKLYNFAVDFNLELFKNSFFSEGVSAVIATEDGGFFKINDKGEAEVETNTTQTAKIDENKNTTAEELKEDATFINEFSHFEGNWEPENSILLLAVGGKLDLGFNRINKTTIRSSAELSSGVYSVDSQIETIVINNTDSSKDIDLTLASGDKNINVKLKVINANRLSATLTSQNNADTLASLVGVELFLNRK